VDIAWDRTLVAGGRDKKDWWAVEILGLNLLHVWRTWTPARVLHGILGARENGSDAGIGSPE